MPGVKGQTPKFIVVSAADRNTSLSDYSCFIVNRALYAISKEIIKIQPIRDGNLLLLVKSKAISDCFVRTKELPGICSISCKLHTNQILSRKQSLPPT